MCNDYLSYVVEINEFIILIFLNIYVMFIKTNYNYFFQHIYFLIINILHIFLNE